MNRDQGFTLVELLLAITLMSILLALAYGGLRASTHATDRGQEILEESGRIRMAHQFIRKQLNQMIPLIFEQAEEDETGSVFLGDSRVIRFVAPMPGYLGFGGPHVQELEIVKGERGLALVMSHALLQGFEESKLFEREPILLLDRIESASFWFLGLDETGELANWSDSWEQPGLLPVSVMLDIEFAEDVYVRWPELVASVRVDSDAIAELAGEQALGKTEVTNIQRLIERRKRRN